MPGAPIGDVAVGRESTIEDEDIAEDEEIVEDEDASNVLPRAVAIIGITTSTPAARSLRIRIRRGVPRARLRLVTPPVKAAWCCRHVCGFRYADDRRGL